MTTINADTISRLREARSADYSSEPDLDWTAAALAACRSARVSPRDVLAYAQALSAIARAQVVTDELGRPVAPEEALELIVAGDDREQLERATRYLRLLGA